MKSLSDIRRHIQPALQKNEQLRIAKLKAISWARIWYLIPLIILSFGIYASQINSQFLTVFSFFVFFILCFVISNFKIAPHRRQFESSFKHDIFSTFVQRLYPNSYYAPDNYLPNTIFRSSQLFGSYDNYGGEDYFEGTTSSGASFKFSELKVTEQSSDSDNSTSTIFKGIFMVLDAPFKLSEPIQILPDTAERNFGKTGKLIQSSIGSFAQQGDMVYFDKYPNFEKEFVVYSKNPSEAKAILTPALINALYELKHNWNQSIKVSFVDNYLYIALSSSHNFFDPKIKQSLLNDAFIQKLYNELSLCFSIVESLSEVNLEAPATNLNSVDANTKFYTKRDASDNPFLM